MKTIIIEDEARAANRLQKLITNLRPEFEIVAIFESVRSATAWFKENEHPQLIFSDIQLADGISFEIFENTPINSQVIFTTAFDNYAIQAFKTNGLDYLLKPIDEDELETAIARFEKLYQPADKPTSISEDTLAALLSGMRNEHDSFKSRYMVRVGEKIKTINCQEIAAFYSLEKATYCLTKEGRNYDLDYTLDQIEAQLNPKQFHRVNRSYVIAPWAAKEIAIYSNSRLKIELENHTEDVIVSRDRVKGFKSWLDA